MKTETFYIARVKKPHKKFGVGEIVIGEITDGQAQRLICWGWSSKLNVFIREYSIRYQGWNDWGDWAKEGEVYQRTTGSGHLTIIGEFELPWPEKNRLPELRREFSRVNTRADFMRQLGLFGGNVLEQVEAAATHPRSYNHAT